MKPVDVVYVQDLNVYELVLSGYNCTWVEETLGGEEKPLPSNKTLALTLDVLDSVVCITTQNVLTHYVSTADPDTTCSPVSYQIHRASCYVDLDEPHTLEEEYEWKKFQAAWKHVYVQETTREAFEYNITEVKLSTGNQYITSLWSHTSVPADSKLYLYNQRAAQAGLFRSLCNEKNVAHEVPTHTHLEYAKIEGEYVFSKQGYGESVRTLKGNLETCKAAYDADVKAITHVVALAAAKKFGVAGDVQWPSVVADLHKVHDMVKGLEVKTKSYHARVNTLVKISDLIKGIEKSVVAV